MELCCCATHSQRRRSPGFLNKCQPQQLVHQLKFFSQFQLDGEPSLVSTQAVVQHFSKDNSCLILPQRELYFSYSCIPSS